MDSLRLLVQQRGPHNWALLARQLGTKRTGFQCLQVYQTHLNPLLADGGTWDQEEDDLLWESVKEKEGRGTDWASLAKLFKNKDPAQCSFRYTWENLGGIWGDLEGFGGI